MEEAQGRAGFPAVSALKVEQGPSLMPSSVCLCVSSFQTQILLWRTTTYENMDFKIILVLQREAQSKGELFLFSFVLVEQSFSCMRI